MALFDINPKETPKALFGREEELGELVHLIREKRWVALIGPRMVGKTSLIKVANTKLDHTGIYVNLWGARSTKGLLNALVHSMNHSKGLLQKIKDGVHRIEGLSLGPSGISVSVPKKPLTTTWDLLNLVGQQSGKCVIELDEVQELAVVSGHLQRVLANIFNTHTNIVFVFTGSMFGLMKTLTEPKSSSSPLYGRPPAKIYLRPFDKKKSMEFLNKGFEEYNVKVSEDAVSRAVEERLDGLPGWLTLYGNNIAVRRLAQEKALEETVSEGLKIVKDELNHYLKGRDRSAHIAALKACATSARWSEVKGAMETRKRKGTSRVNDATVYNVISSLKSGMLIDEEQNAYRVIDPMLRTLLLTTRIT